ncbi:DUF6538 domain-containing protein [Photobacterium damselae]|uniref:DUF6538 domain-containing protein n=1 Tax=Photobacterium damselae TaxID=38293 RepID=UPI003A599413
MYLCKNRHSNYYSRICIPKHLRLLGFPSEIRFSLETKNRTEGLDRSLPIAMVARQWFKEMTDTQPTSVHFALQQLRLSVAHIKHNGYTSISMEAPARLSSPRSLLRWSICARKSHRAGN